MSDNFFKPLLGIKNPHAQTLLGYGLGKQSNPISQTEFVKLSDGDEIALEVSTPLNWSTSGQIVLLMPGTGGSHLSPYMIRMANRLLKSNILVMRLNYRGVATAQKKARNISHAGSSADINEALLFIKAQYPQAIVTAVGFSLSGNTLLKLAGEKDLSQLVDHIIAVCPPLELEASSLRLERRQNALYRRSLVSGIIEIIENNEGYFTYQPTKPLRTCKTLRELDEVFTAPASGFQSAKDYYQKSSSLHLLSNINQRCSLLFAKDDPLIDCSRVMNMALPQNMELVVTKHGGHMGFLQNSRSPFWMDQKLCEWISQR